MKTEEPLPEYNQALADHIAQHYTAIGLKIALVIGIDHTDGVTLSSPIEDNDIIIGLLQSGIDKLKNGSKYKTESEHEKPH